MGKPRTARQILAAEKQREQARKAREFNAPIRGRGVLSWVFHPATKTAPAIREIVFHFRDLQGRVDCLKVQKNQKVSQSFTIWMDADNIFELETVATGTVAVIVDVKTSKTRYGANSRKDCGFSYVPCVKVTFRIQDFVIRKDAGRTEFSVKHAPGETSRIGCPGFKDSVSGAWGTIDGGFWLENVH